MLIDNVSILTLKGNRGNETKNDKKFIELCMIVYQAALRYNEENKING